MAVQQEQSSAQQATQPSDKLYMENTLLRVFGVLFCHDPKRARTRSGKIEVNSSLLTAVLYDKPEIKREP